MKLTISSLNIIQQLEPLIQDKNENKLFIITMIGFVTILLLLIINLFKVYKQKKRIKFLENELINNSK